MIWIDYLDKTRTRPRRHLHDPANDEDDKAEVDGRRRLGDHRRQQEGQAAHRQLGRHIRPGQIRSNLHCSRTARHSAAESLRCCAGVADIVVLCRHAVGGNQEGPPANVRLRR